jgi:hypothetical protein
VATGFGAYGAHAVGGGAAARATGAKPDRTSATIPTTHFFTPVSWPQAGRIPCRSCRMVRLRPRIELPGGNPL